MGRETGGGWARRKGGGLAACRNKQVKQILTFWSSSFNSKGKNSDLGQPTTSIFCGQLEFAQSTTVHFFH